MASTGACSACTLHSAPACTLHSAGPTAQALPLTCAVHRQVVQGLVPPSLFVARAILLLQRLERRLHLHDKVAPSRKVSSSCQACTKLLQGTKAHAAGKAGCLTGQASQLRPPAGKCIDHQKARCMLPPAQLHACSRACLHQTLLFILPPAGAGVRRDLAES